MQTHFDVLVVGAGPAGSAAARTLAAGGLSVALFDRRCFPRDKLCGGLLTLRSKALFEEIFQTGWDSVIDCGSADVDFYLEGKKLNEVRDYKPFYFTCRRKYDAFLVDLAVAQGATLIAGSAVRSLDAATTTVQLDDGRQFTGNYVIGADGVNSVIRKGLGVGGVNKKNLGFGLEFELPRNEAGDLRDMAHPEIHFNVAEWGYGWVFPKAETLTVGIGGIWERNPDMKEKLRSFFKSRFGRELDHKFNGHYFPFGNYLKVPGKGNGLLCGDAAGLVEPITGEGIAFSMHSGYLAGQAILAAAQHRDSRTALSHYQSRYAVIARDFFWARVLRTVIFHESIERKFMAHFGRSKVSILRYMDLLAGDIGHRSYAWQLGKRIMAKVLRSS